MNMWGKAFNKNLSYGHIILLIDMI